MTLQDIEFPVCWDQPPAEILRTIEIAENLSRHLIPTAGDHRIAGLENSNFYMAYHALNHIRTSDLTEDCYFCEWGSGLGVVTCIASQLGFKATGIEIDRRLCDFAKLLAETLSLNAEFIEGSYRPEQYSTAASHALNPRLPFPLGNRHCDIVYAYPWPAEESFIETLYTQAAPESSLLMTFHGGARLRLRRKFSPGQL